MNISVFGLGYVGCVCVGCLAELGHRMIGIDIDPAKVKMINNGRATIVENEIDEIIAKQHKAGNIKATIDFFKPVIETDISLLCVPTPRQRNGRLDLKYINNAAEQIAKALAKKKSWHTIAIRSTVMPGTLKNVINIIAHNSGKIPNEDFGVVIVPEFLREGTSVRDFLSPPMIVIGGSSKRATKHIREMFTGIDAPVFEVKPQVAELIKCICNSFHALKIVFANEVGSLCKEIGIDPYELMEVFVADKQLNISAAYLKPGFAYGGSCLPKDLSALQTLMHEHHIEAPIVSNIEQSNYQHKQRALNMVMDTGRKKILVLGLSFKEGTDDLRNSPAVELIESLIGKGFEVCIYDPNVSLSRLIGTNKKYIETVLPHINEFLTDDLDAAITNAEVIVITANDPVYRNAIDKVHDKAIIELVRITSERGSLPRQGICW